MYYGQYNLTPRAINLYKVHCKDKTWVFTTCEVLWVIEYGPARQSEVSLKSGIIPGRVPRENTQRWHLPNLSSSSPGEGVFTYRVWPWLAALGYTGTDPEEASRFSLQDPASVALDKAFTRGKLYHSTRSFPYYQHVWNITLLHLQDNQIF